MFRWCVLFLILPALTFSVTEEKLNTLYSSLASRSISEHLAFYQLYPSTDQGKQALSDAWSLLCAHRSDTKLDEVNISLPNMEIGPIISLVNKEPFETETPTDPEGLSLIERIGDHLTHNKLKGHYVWSIDAVKNLKNDEVDLARALLIYQFDKDPEMTNKIRQYEATIDLMALQILAMLPETASNDEKIDAINTFIFHEKQFRFPPHSLWVKDIDHYTFLPSVLDNRLGVCLGVSILYLSIGQRLNIPLEIVTPPGHIFLRYNNRNIETTARGISPPSREYLGINTRHLQTRSIKEVIGLAFVNQASVAWGQKDHKKAVKLYEQALPFMEGDPLLKMLLGYNYLFVNKKKQGRALLKEIESLTFDHAVYKETVPEDYLQGRVNSEGIQAIFEHVDETYNSIVKKQKKLKKILKSYPYFRDGLLQLATTYLQLGHTREALDTLLKYHKIDPNNPTVEYYLSLLCTKRLRYQEAWDHLKIAQAITESREHTPICLKGLHHNLRTLYLDPSETARAQPLTVAEVINEGEALKLSDGTAWKVAPEDRSTTALWLLSPTIEIHKRETTIPTEYPYVLSNTSNQTEVEATSL